jgi:hypothetical protein
LGGLAFGGAGAVVFLGGGVLAGAVALVGGGIGVATVGWDLTGGLAGATGARTVNVVVACALLPAAQNTSRE